MEWLGVDLTQSEVDFLPLGWGSAVGQVDRVQRGVVPFLPEVRRCPRGVDIPVAVRGDLTILANLGFGFELGTRRCSGGECSLRSQSHREHHR